MFKKNKPKPVKRKIPTVQGWIEAILFAFVIVFPIKNYTLQNFKIPSSSMEKSLLIGDYLIANKLKYFFTDPQREDIVTFKSPADPTYPQPSRNYARLIGPIYWNKEKWGLKWQEKKNVVKRVIGVPGDTIQIKNKKVYINGALFERKYEQYVDKNNLIGREPIVWNSKDRKYLGSDVNFGDFDRKIIGTRDNIGPFIVPEDAYFVMGDNRDMSLDSRYWGFLDKNLITGTPTLIVFSTGEPPTKDVRTYILKQRGQIKEKSRVRWERTFKFIK